jgi:hypothetical protein
MGMKAQMLTDIRAINRTMEPEVTFLHLQRSGVIDPEFAKRDNSDPEEIVISLFANNCIGPLPESIETKSDSTSNVEDVNKSVSTLPMVKS